MISINNIESWKINEDWYFFLKEYFDLQDFKELQRKVDEDYSRLLVLPSSDKIFASFNLCPLERLKVVILGQDPYPSSEHACGLAFSSKSKKTPGSLKNIYKELKDDLKVPQTEVFKTNDLSSWATEGVLLLNTVLTYSPKIVLQENKKQKNLNLHFNYNWQAFSDFVLEKISLNFKNLVFILWGNNAIEKENLIENKESHLIIKSAHPSPFSARLGFFGSKPFSKTNDFLKAHNKEEINWLKGLL